MEVTGVRRQPRTSSHLAQFCLSTVKEIKPRVRLIDRERTLLCRSTT